MSDKIVPTRKSRDLSGNIILHAAGGYIRLTSNVQLHFTSLGRICIYIDRSRS